MLGLEEARQPLAVRGAQVGRHDQVGHVAPDRLVRAVAEDRLGGVVPAEHEAAVVHRHDRVERRLEHRPHARLAGAHLGLGAAPRDELADLAADHVHRREQLLVGLARARVRRARSRRARRAGSATGTPNAAWRPLRRAASARGKFASSGASIIQAASPVCEHAARQALAARERDPLAERLELVRAVARVPRADAAKPIVVRRRPPRHAPSSHPSELPDRLEHTPRRPRQAGPFPRGSGPPRARRAEGRRSRRPAPSAWSLPSPPLTLHRPARRRSAADRGRRRQRPSPRGNRVAARGRRPRGRRPLAATPTT